MPKPYGSGTLSRLTWIEELLAPAQAVISALRWHGMAGIEFMRDRKDGRWKVVEVNFRPWLHIYMQCYFGFNHFAMLHEDAYGDLAPYAGPHVPTPELVASRPLNINLAAVVAGAADANDGTSATEHLDRWMADTKGTLTFEYINADDPEPGLRELAYLAESLGGALDTAVSLANILCTAATRDAFGGG